MYAGVISNSRSGLGQRLVMYSDRDRDRDRDASTVTMKVAVMYRMLVSGSASGSVLTTAIEILIEWSPLPPPSICSALHRKTRRGWSSCCP